MENPLNIQIDLSQNCQYSTRNQTWAVYPKELDVAQRKFENRKAGGLDEILPEV